MIATVEPGPSAAALAASLAQLAVAAMLALGVPLLAKRRTDRLLFELPRDPNARLKLYARAIAGAWLMAAAVLAAWPRSGRALAELGLRAPQVATALGAAGTWTLLIGIGAGLVLGTLRMLKSPPAVADVLARTPLRARAIVPATRTERGVWILVSLTAGFTEELLYRGFLPAFLAPLFAGNAVLAWIVATALFGLGHVYQGRRAVLATTVLGGIFAAPTILLGSIWPAVVLHALFDVRAVAFPAALSFRAGEPLPGGPEAPSGAGPPPGPAAPTA